MVDFDVAIVGGGIVGLSTAFALADSGMNIAIIDAKHDIYNKLDQRKAMIRASAINLASKAFFEKIGLWNELENSGRILSFDSIDVKEKQGYAKLQANSTHYQYDQLGYIIENQLIQNMLYHQIINQHNIQFLHNHVNDIFFSLDRGFIELSDGNIISAKLIIGSDGANSLVRKKQGIKLLQHSYRHNAIIATIETKLSHQNCARQVFYSDGIIAFLPLWQPNISCLVWSTKPDLAINLQEKSNESFCQVLDDLTDKCLGDSQLISDRLVFPLIARYCPQPIKERLILIGDAAHTIHPLAGQGVNLGLEDVAKLTEVIKKNYLSGNDIGKKALYCHYQLDRHKATLSMLSAMEIIQDIFDGSSPIKRLVRGVGMNLINSMPLIKKPLIKYALGL